MKITIDTKEDSKEEIKKAIQLLSSLVEGRVGANKDLFSSDSGSSDNAFANMFGDDKVEEKKVEEGTPIDFGNLVSLRDDSKKEEKEDEEDIPKVVSY